MSFVTRWFLPPESNLRAYGLLALFGFLMTFAGTWILPLIDRDEPRFAEATREMIQRGDYLVPHFNNYYRFDKPPLIYWMQVPSVLLFGENEMAVRLPSVVTATLTGLLVFGFALRMYDRRVAWFSSLAFYTTLQVLIHAKASVADFAMIFFVTAAFWAAWELLQPGAAKRWRWIFWVSLALGFLAKGPIAWLPIGVLAWMRFAGPMRNQSDLKPVGWLTGSILMLAIVAAWGVPALVATNGEYFHIGIGKHVVERSLTAMEGHGAKNFGVYLLTLPLYFVTIFLSFFPWCLKLPWMVKTLRKGRREKSLGSNEQFLLCGVVLTFLIFTLVKTKLPHYTLPCFPLLTILLVGLLLKPGGASAESGERFLRKGIKGMVLLNVVLAFVIFPLASPLFPSKQLWQSARDSLTPEMEFASVVFQEPSLVWYFRNDVTGFHSILQPGFMDKPGDRFCILPAEQLETFFPDGTKDWEIHRSQGINVVKGKTMDLLLIIKRE